MFASKSTILLALFAVSARLVSATPPACLLKAVNTEEAPADLETCCGRDAPKIQANIQDMCGDYTDAAMKAFKETCKSVGKEISLHSSSHSATESGSHSTSHSASATSAPYPIVHTSTYYDTECSCSKTTVISSSGSSPASTGFATGTIGSTGAVTGPAATGSPIVPTSPIAPTGSSSTAGPTFTGAASRNMGSYAAAAVAGAGVLMAL